MTSSYWTSIIKPFRSGCVQNQRVAETKDFNLLLHLKKGWKDKFPTEAKIETPSLNWKLNQIWCEQSRVGKSVAGMALQVLRRNILQNAELQWRNKEKAVLMVILRNVAETSLHEHQEVHKIRVTRLQLDVILLLVMVAPVTVATTRLVAAQYWRLKVSAEWKKINKKVTATFDSG